MAKRLEPGRIDFPLFLLIDDDDGTMPLLTAIGERTNTRHRGTMEPADVSMRVIADHMRAMTFLIVRAIGDQGRFVEVASVKLAASVVC